MDSNWLVFDQLAAKWLKGGRHPSLAENKGFHIGNESRGLTLKCNGKLEQLYKFQGRMGGSPLPPLL
jgi:hypothetical protein